MLLLTYVVPQFETIFAQAGKALPLATQIVIDAGHFAQNTGGRSFGAILVIGYWWRWQMSQQA